MRRSNATVALIALVLFGSVLVIGATGSVSAGSASSAVTSATDATVTDSVDDGAVTDYVDDDGVVDTDGLREAIDDWRDDDVDTDLLRDVIDAWRSGEAVPVVENADLETGYASIQAAVDDAEAGDTLELAPVTFEEDATVDIDGLTIRSAGDSPATIDATETGLLVDADDVTVEGVTVTVDDDVTLEAYGVDVTGDATNVTIVDTHFDLERSGLTSSVHGISLEGDDATIERNVFEATGDALGVRTDRANGTTIAENEFTNGMGVYTWGEDVRIEHNTFTDTSTFAVRTDLGTQEITNNSMSESDIGIWLGNIQSATITDNDIDGTNNGIQLSSYTGALITNNSVTDATTGIYAPENANSALEDVSVNWNAILETDEGINVTHGDGTLDATNNWWGDETGPGGAGPGAGASVTDNVEFAPWLDEDGTSTPTQVLTGDVGVTDLEQGQDSVDQSFGSVDGGDALEIDFDTADVESAFVTVELTDLLEAAEDDPSRITDDATVEVEDDAVTNATVYNSGINPLGDEAVVALEVHDRTVTVEEFTLTGLDTTTADSDEGLSYDVTLTDVYLEGSTEVTNVEAPTETQPFQIVSAE